MASAAGQLQTVSASSVGSADLADAWSRQRAVILAYSRRTPSEAEADALIHDAAALIAETLQAPMFCSVRAAEESGQLSLKFAGGPAGEGLATRSSGSGNDSLAGYALSVRQPVICEDLAQESRCKDAFLRNHGVVGALVLPLVTDECRFGAVGVFYTQQLHLAPADLEFAETIAQMLVSTLARLRAENGWRAERQMAASLFQHVDSLVIMTDPLGGIQRINRACEETTGYSSAEVRGRPAWSTFAVPEEAEQAHRRLREGTAQGDSAANFELVLLTKRGARRPARWTQTVLMDDFGQAQSVLISGSLLPDELRADAGNRSGKSAARAAVDRAGAADGSREGVQPFQAISQPGFDGVRSSPRRAYPYRQRVAPLTPGVRPDQLPFEEVQFHDISAGGVSFRMVRRPDYDTVVLALGVAPSVHYISARIVNVAEVVEQGVLGFHVGCRFLERLQA